MRLTMKERKVVTKALSAQYRRASKGEKNKLLARFVLATGYNRCYAAWLLRNHGRKVHINPMTVLEGNVHKKNKTKSRQRKYGKQELDALKKIWKMMDFICGKRLAPALQEIVPRLVALKEIRVSKATQKKLIAMSPATIDRMLKTEREKHTIKGRTQTKPGTLLKHQVPIRTFSDWDDAKPGFLEMDLVGHDGGVAKGDYCYTLDITDVASGWTEQVAVQNKAQIWVFEALQKTRQRLPFDVLGLDSDNGSEFINHHLVRFCQEQKITFTRARPYRKNDNCYIEQKNWSIVRRFVGYARYDNPVALDLLNQLYGVLRDYNNFFLPSMKLKEKTRDGARVQRRYDRAKTPYQRLLESPHISPAVKKQLQDYYQTLNPAALYRQVRQLQNKLLKVATRPIVNPEMSLSLSCQSEGVKNRGAKASARPSFVLAPETALGSLSSVALSSAQADSIVHQNTSRRSPNFT